MRKPFLETLTKLAEQDENVIFIIGDVGFSHIEAYRQRFPKQFLNAGIAEQNMMGAAAGMALQGLKPYIYTMKNFILLRPYEQLRNDIGCANANVKLFGVDGERAYAFRGMSHNLPADEERDILRHIPNLETYAPQTEEEMAEQMQKEYNRNGPAYFAI